MTIIILLSSWIESIIKNFILFNIFYLKCHSNQNIIINNHSKIVTIFIL